jgi:hypothetical protein
MYKVIKCPHCRCEYLPGEIFNPTYFLGQPTDVIRNGYGEVLGHMGVEQDTTETFICGKCEKEFKVTAKISYVFEEEEKDDLFEQLSLF